MVDLDNGRPLPFASLSLVEANPRVGTLSDSMGVFRVPDVPVGRVDLECKLIGYETQVLPGLLIYSGKELVLEIRMKAAPAELEAIVVSAARTVNNAALVSVQTITVEETRRFAASYFDPARVATSFGGVAGTNDQANHLSVRGNSPNGIQWKLEGLEIVNPNHTSNAGTFSDRPTQSGGGVNSLSAQVLGNSDFLSGAFPAEFGNVLGGTFDMRLREGNDQQGEYTVQAGLIGLNLAAEGPFRKGKSGSYLVNYRYSTVGLLSLMGVDLGDEEISFQDLSFHVSLPAGQRGKLSLFGLAGLSRNRFEAQRDTTQWETEKDRFDIGFGSQIGVIGGSYTLRVSNRTVWHTALAASGLKSTREADRLDDQLTVNRLETDTVHQRLISINSYLGHSINDRHFLKGGVTLSHRHYFLFSETDTVLRAEGSGGGWLIQPYFRWQGRVLDRLTLYLGGHMMAFSFNDMYAVEPRRPYNGIFRAGNPFVLHTVFTASFSLPRCISPASRTVQTPTGIWGSVGPITMSSATSSIWDERCSFGRRFISRTCSIFPLLTSPAVPGPW